MTFKNKDGLCIVKDLIKTIQDNKDFLSEVDGKIGDGDHGINMNKGFSLCGTRIEGKECSMSEGFKILGKTLLEDIGGSMGPLYGVFFDELASGSNEIEEIDSKVFEAMMTAALKAIIEIGSAKKGDKTLLDTLIPSIEAFSDARLKGKDFSTSLVDMENAAEAGWKSTEGMVAKIGRASRLGERSRGVLDAGATSCYLIIRSMARSMRGLMQAE
jgi:dihydroxyacetone kinase-like protein